jgi:glucosamine-phosphate N-acetyltransferase
MNNFLFSPNYLKWEEEKEIIIRPLHLEDYNKGYLFLLKQLTDIENLNEEKFQKRFKELQLEKNVYFIIVLEDIIKKRIIGTGTIFLEKKIVHGAGLCGHIEDVVIDENYRGKKLGQRIVEHLIYLAKKNHCYKIILNCSEKNISFYEKCGFKKKEFQMVFYLPRSNG